MKTTRTTHTTTTHHHTTIRRALALLALSAFSLFSAAAQTYTPKPTAPVIAKQPASVTVNSGQAVNVTFTVTAAGTQPLAYKWQLSTNNGATWSDAPNQGVYNGAATATFTINGSPSSTFPGSYNGMQYRCLVTNQAGSATSAPATFNVKPAITPAASSALASALAASNNKNPATNATLGAIQDKRQTKPIFTKQPGPNAQFQPGRTITLTVSATANPAPAYKWMWSAGPNSEIHTPVTATDPSAQAAFSSIQTTFSGMATDTLTITNPLAPISGRTFWCVATNTIGSTNSNTLTLTLAPGAPVITKQPAPATTALGKPATLAITATGAPALAYMWQMANPDAPAKFFNLVTDSPTRKGVTTPTLTLTPDNSGFDKTLYRCVVANNYDSVPSAPATLTVSGAPVITKQPENLTITAGPTATFTVNATGYPTPSYQWYLNVNTVNGQAWVPMTNNASRSGVTTSAFQVLNTTAPESLGNSYYHCVVTNSAGSVTTTTAMLTVQCAPAITKQPSTIYVSRNKHETAKFTVQVKAFPVPAYQWQISTDGNTLNNKTWSNLADSALYSGVTTPALSVKDPPPSLSQACYRCAIKNPLGNINSNYVVLVVDP